MGRIEAECWRSHSGRRAIRGLCGRDDSRLPDWKGNWGIARAAYKTELRSRPAALCQSGRELALRIPV